MTITHPPLAETCQHEAQHAAALILSGMTPTHVRVDQPGDNDEGSTTMDWQHHALNPATALDALLAVIAPAAAAGHLNTISLEWPIQPHTWPDGFGRDGEQAELLARFIDLDGLSWMHLCHRAHIRGRSIPYKRLVHRIARALEDKELLLQPELQAIASED